MKTTKAMIFSDRVVYTLNSLSQTDRDALSAALVNEFYLDNDPELSLNAMQRMLYVILRQYVGQALHRCNNSDEEFVTSCYKNVTAAII